VPKEFIHCRDFGRSVPVHAGEDEDGKEILSMAPLDSDAVKVGWSKESEHVELAVVQSVAGSFVEHGFEDMLQAGGETDPEKLLAIGRLTPRYLQLDRNGCNRLINTIRQARDDAFGKDA
jgi:hypothetical protein